MNAMELYAKASTFGIRIVPGPMFLPSGGYQNLIRLNTRFPGPERTGEQVQVLGDLVDQPA